MKSSICFLLSALLILPGCATILSGTTQSLQISSDVSGTTIFMDDQEIGKNQAVVWVPKKNLNQVIFVAKKAGCRDVSTGIATKIDPFSMLGLLLDMGLISILVVDWQATGAVLEAERTHYLLNPECPAL